MLNEEQKKTSLFNREENKFYFHPLHHSSSSWIHFRCSIFKFHSLPPQTLNSPPVVLNILHREEENSFFPVWRIDDKERHHEKSNLMCSCSMQKAVRRKKMGWRWWSTFSPRIPLFNILNARRRQSNRTNISSTTITRSWFRLSISQEIFMFENNLNKLWSNRSPYHFLITSIKIKIQSFSL